MKLTLEQFRERFWKRYEYTLKNDRIIFWEHWKNDITTYVFWDGQCYQNLQTFIDDHHGWLLEFGDIKPEYSIWDTIVVEYSRWERITVTILAISDNQSYISYYTSHGKRYKPEEILFKIN